MNKKQKNKTTPDGVKSVDKGIVNVRGYTVRMDHYPKPGPDGIRDFDVFSSRTKLGVLAPGLRVRYTQPALKAYPSCRVGGRTFSGPAGLARIATRVGIGEEQPFVAVLYMHFSEILVGVSTQNSWFAEAQLLDPECLHQKAIIWNASAVVLVHMHGWENNPLPTEKDIEQSLALLKALRHCGVHLMDHLILGLEDDLSAPLVFSFLARNMLPVCTPGGEWVWGEVRYP